MDVLGGGIAEEGDVAYEIGGEDDVVEGDGGGDFVVGLVDEGDDVAGVDAGAAMGVGEGVAVGDRRMEETHRF